MKPLHRILLTLGICVLLIVVFYLITDAITKYTGFSVKEIEKNEVFDNFKYFVKSPFIRCLERKDIRLYINTQEPSLTLKKLSVFDYLEGVKIFNCFRNKEKCLEADIKNFPTWAIEGKKISRDISLKELEELSGCKRLS